MKAIKYKTEIVYISTERNITMYYKNDYLYVQTPIVLQ